MDYNPTLFHMCNDHPIQPGVGLNPFCWLPPSLALYLIHPHTAHTAICEWKTNCSMRIIGNCVTHLVADHCVAAESPCHSSSSSLTCARAFNAKWVKLQNPIILLYYFPIPHIACTHAQRHTFTVDMTVQVPHATVNTPRTQVLCNAMQFKATHGFSSSAVGCFYVTIDLWLTCCCRDF